MNLILYINLVPHLKISNQLVKDLPFFEIFILQNLTVRLDIYIILFFTKPLLQTSEVVIYIYTKIKITEPRINQRLSRQNQKMDSSRIGIAEEGGPYSYHPLADGDTISSDDVRLKQLGYKQELTRGLSYACFLFLFSSPFL